MEENHCEVEDATGRPAPAAAAITLDDVYRAAFTLKGVARRTDLIQATRLKPGCSLYLKTENLQRTGSFKVRGAYNKISSLTEEERSRGAIACSAGNHAQGVALAATRFGISSLICMPATAPISKVESTKHYGAEVCLVSGVYDDAHDKAVELQRETGRTFIHPFNDPLVIAGQATIGLEILDQLPEVDVVLVPVGGGGLASGVAFAVKSLKPSCKVYGVQASGAAGMAHALAAGRLEGVDSVHTLADGIAVKCPEELTFELCSTYLDGILTVGEDEICTEILQLIEREKVVAEGAGAASVAAALFDKVELAGKNVACVVSGGNIDVTILSRVINRGLLRSGRQVELSVWLPDRPGALSDVTRIIGGEGANISSIQHDRNGLDDALDSCRCRVQLETRDAAHVAQVRAALCDRGYRVE